MFPCRCRSCLLRYFSHYLVLKTDKPKGSREFGGAQKLNCSRPVTCKLAGRAIHQMRVTATIASHMCLAELWSWFIMRIHVLLFMENPWCSWLYSLFSHKLQKAPHSQVNRTFISITLLKNLIHWSRDISVSDQWVTCQPDKLYVDWKHLQAHASL